MPKVISVGGIVGCLKPAGACIAMAGRRRVDRAFCADGLVGLRGRDLCDGGAPHDSVFTSSAGTHGGRVAAVLGPMGDAGGGGAGSGVRDARTFGVPAGDTGRAWVLVRGLLELVAGCIVLWLAVAWGLVPEPAYPPAGHASYRLRLAQAFFLSLGGASQLLGLAASGARCWDWARCMDLSWVVSARSCWPWSPRVSCGHSGRALVATTPSGGWFRACSWRRCCGYRAPSAGAPGELILVATYDFGRQWRWGRCTYGSCGFRFGRPRVDGKPG